MVTAEVATEVATEEEEEVTGVAKTPEPIIAIMAMVEIETCTEEEEEEEEAAALPEVVLVVLLLASPELRAKAAVPAPQQPALSPV